MTGRGLAAGLLASIAVLATADVAWCQPSEADVFVAAARVKKADLLASLEHAMRTT